VENKIMKKLVKKIEVRSMPTLVEQRNNLLDEMEGLLSKSKAETRALTDEESNRFDEIKKEIAKIDKTLTAEEESRAFEKKEIKKVVGEEEKRALEIKEEERSFIEFIKGDTRALNSSTNGAVIPASIANKIVDKVVNISPLLSEVTVFNVAGDLNFPVYDYTTHTTAYATEFTDLTASGGTFTAVSLKSNIIGSLAKIGKSLINRAEIDVVSYIVNAIAKSIAQFLENELIIGTGGAGKLNGLKQIAVGQQLTGATTLVIASDELVKLQMKVPQSLQGNAKWLMHPNTLAYVQSLKSTTGQFLMGNTLSENGRWVLLGKEVMVSDAMPQIAAGALEIYYGDFSGVYMKITKNVDIQVLQELYAAQYAVGIAAFAEVDSIIVEPQKIVAYKGL
jgi:HK97 family phage major capsid protein